jgi:hypothetical protein
VGAGASPPARYADSPLNATTSTAPSAETFRLSVGQVRDVTTVSEFFRAYNAGQIETALRSWPMTWE